MIVGVQYMYMKKSLSMTTKIEIPQAILIHTKGQEGPIDLLWVQVRFEKNQVFAHLTHFASYTFLNV